MASATRCWKCWGWLTKDRRSGGLFFAEREIQPGQSVRMHIVCADSWDAEQANKSAARPKLYGHGPDRDEPRQR